MTMCKFHLDRILLALLFTFYSLYSIASAPQVKGFTIYLKCLTKPKLKQADTIGVSYDMNYPFIKHARKIQIIPANGINKVFPVYVKAHLIQLNYRLLLVNPGDTIHFSLDNKRNVVIHSRDSLINDFFTNKKHNFLSKNEVPFRRLNDTTNLDNYTSYCISFAQKEQAYIDSVFGDRKAELKQYLLQKSALDLISNLVSAYRKLGATKKDSIFFTSLAELQLLHNPYTPYDYSYRLALRDYVTFVAGQYLGDLNPRKMSVMLDTAKKVLAIKEQHYLRLTLLSIISNLSRSEYDPITKRIYRELATAKLTTQEKLQVKQLYEGALVMSKELKDFYSIKMQKMNGETVTLNDVVQPGKILVADFWASWCVPCIAEIPSLKKLTNDYPGVQVVSFSVDTNKQAWLKSSKKYKLAEDQNFLLPDAKRSILMRHYNIDNVPRFLIFDKDGICITSNAPNPSSPSFEKLIQDLMEQ